MNIRLATENDAESLLEIYAPYVEETAITFEYVVPTADEFRGRIRETLKNYPYYVAESDGKIAGYAYAGRFKERNAYDWAVETSIYVKKNLRRAGIGSALLKRLESTLARQNILNANACIAQTDGPDEHLQTQAYIFTKNKVTAWPENSTTAAINSTAGTIWSGWKKCSAGTGKISRRSFRSRN